MIRGLVNAFDEAVIQVQVVGPTGARQQVEAATDAGFNGYLTLPHNLIAALALSFRRRGRALLADGSESLFDVYEATVEWDGNPRRMSVDSADTMPLVGMALLRGWELRIEVVHGGEVSINALPAP